MPSIRVTVADQALSISKTADVPDNVAMSQLVPALVTKLGLPTSQYTLMCKRLGRTLLDADTLASAGVQNNDELRLVPTITGARKCHR